MNKKAVTSKRLLIAILILAMPSIVVSLLSNELRSDIEKNTNILILVIIGIENGVKVEDHIEVLPDFPMNRAEKIATAKGFAVVKKYITKKEADKLIFKEWDNTTPGVTVVEYYRPTKASL